MVKGFKKLFKWAKKYWFLLVIIFALTVVNPLTYSYVPQFFKYIVDFVLVNKAFEEGSNSLPSFLIAYFESIPSPLKTITIAGIILVLFQLFRGLIMFGNGYVKGKMSESIAFDMRTKLYKHIQDLSYSYQNNADTGDLIQRCTSDVETIKSFLTAQLHKYFI